MKTVRLDQIAESLPCDYGDEPNGNGPTFDVVKVSNVSAKGELYGKFEKRQFCDSQVDTLLVREGELLVVKSSGSKANILSGKTAICDRDRAGKIVASNFLLRLRVDEAVAVPSFIWYVLNSSRSKAFVKTIVGASTYPNLKWSLYSSHPIPLPPLPEQQRIAEILDKADALRTKRRAALAVLDTLTQSIFLDMFGDPATILHRWPVSKLGEHLVFLTSGSRGWAKHYSERGDLFLRIQNVRRDELSLDDVAYVTAPDTAEAKRTSVEPGDVLLSITADLGRTAVVPKGLGAAYINQHLAILRTKSFVPRFLSAYLASPSGRSQLMRQNRQAVKAGLNFDDIRSVVVPFPPVTAQGKFEAMAAKVATLERAQSKVLTQLDSLFASLQHRAFRGDSPTNFEGLSGGNHALGR